MEQEKKFAIARCRTILGRAKKLYLQAELSDEEYQRVRDEAEREITHWENRTQDISRMYLQMEKCAVMVESFTHAWDNGKDAERYELVHSLFDEIVIDMDTRRITGFSLKSWAEQFLVVRVLLYDMEKQKNQPENGTGSMFQERNTTMPKYPQPTNPAIWKPVFIVILAWIYLASLTGVGCTARTTTRILKAASGQGPP